MSTTPTAGAKSAATSCASCWGLTAPTIGQAVVTTINHLFNSAFNWVSALPANPISNLIEGSLVLIRRSLFGFVPTGVAASQTGDSLTVSVNTGSVAYFRVNGSTVEVAGDPGFTNAQQFAAPKVGHVVTNANSNGNAGCAGFVFTTGAMGSDLTTNGIDYLRFGSDAAFLKTVVANAVPGSLEISGAVRGLTGVTVNAPVIVATDTEIDAGAGSATFAGAVDGKGWFGGQSLTVTALQTTTFAAAVGGKTPLGSLTTQGVTPLRIKQSQDSRTIPLHFVQLGTGNGLEVKYGIDVAIGDNPSRMYLFDTGGNGFFAGYDPAFFKGVNLGTDPVAITYTSGETLNGVLTSTNLTIGTGSQTVSTVPKKGTAQPVDISAVVTATNGSGQPIDPNNPFGGPFVGDFGGAFGIQHVTGQTGYEPNTFITSPLFQLPGNLSSGYLTQLGPIGSTPTLTVGVTDALRAQFPYAIPISEATNQQGDSVGNYPYTANPLLNQFGFSAQYLVSQPFPNSPIPLGQGPLPTLIDSGGGSTSARLPELPKPYMDAGGNLTPGTTFTGLFPSIPGYPALQWNFVAGDISSVNQVGYMNSTGQATNVPNVNTGLNLFNNFDVMYDVAHLDANGQPQQVIWLRPNGGQATVSLRSVTTRGDQNYRENAVLNGTYTTNGHDFTVAGITTLNGDTQVNAGRGNATFSGTVDAATAGVPGLQVNSRSATNFARAVGGQAALASLQTDGRGCTSTAEVTTTGGQSYGDDVTLDGTYSAGSGGFSVGGSAALAGPTSVSTSNSPIVFGGSIDSAAGAGNVLNVSAGGGTVRFNGRIGASNPLGGLNIRNTATATAAKAVNLQGDLNNSQGVGLFIGDGVTADFAKGGTIGNFTNTGVVFEGDSPASTLKGFKILNNVDDGIQLVGRNYLGTLISDNTITGNSGFGIEMLQAAHGLAIRNNTIGAKGEANPWGYTTNGPNAQGIVLAPGKYTGTVIADNTIAYNRGNGIAASGGVQGVLISGNTLQKNNFNGIGFAGGDFTGTIVSGNTISGNGGDGISLGAGIGQALNDFGNPFTGYRDADPNNAADTNPYPLGHYQVTYANNPDFYIQVPPDPTVTVTVQGNDPLANSDTLDVPLDTGSRALYFAQSLVPNLDASAGTPGYVYLNSSNRLFFGNWVTTDISFPQSTWVGATQDSSRKATAQVPVLVVEAVGASNTPQPGSTTASTTFSTTPNSGIVNVTNGKQTQQVQIQAAAGGGGTVTIDGGWWATYADNPGILKAVVNFGIGFDRTGLGTQPVTNGNNQSYNTFLNLTEMRDGTMRPGYVITANGITLGLDSTVSGSTPYAYTDLAPTGLSAGKQNPPDWQPMIGRVTYASGPPSPGTTYAPGPLVIDMGISTGILTLPGYGPTDTFTGALIVDPMNTGSPLNPGPAPKVFFNVVPGSTTNQMSATSVSFFSPLPGAYSQNMPSLNQQFFNTGRKVIAGMNYLYDAGGGYLGLYAPTDPADKSKQAEAFRSAGGVFEPGFYPNSTLPGGVTNLSIQNNTLFNNGADGATTGYLGNGITVSGQTSTGNVMYGNTMYGNAGTGIALTNGGNAGQPAPVITSATVGNSTVRVTGSITAVGGHAGPFQVQVFSSPASDAGNVEGRTFLGAVNAQSTDFIAELPSGTTRAGDFITVVVTPGSGAPNTSPFSAPSTVTKKA